MELNNYATIEHDGKSFKVYFSMTPTEFFLLLDFWLDERPAFTAENFSFWVYLNLANKYLLDIMPQIDMRNWYVMPAQGTYYLRPMKIS